MLLKKLPFIYLFFVAGLLVFINCSGDEEIDIMDDMQNVPDIVVKPDTIISLSSFLDIPTAPGLYENDMELSDGKFWNYKLKVPNVQNDRQVALIIGLVWAGEINDHHTYFDCLLEPSFTEIDAILFVPADNFGTWVNADVEQRILEFINYAKLHWPINPDQIVITGYSIGGYGSWYYTMNHDTIFRAGIPMASIHGFRQNPKLPIYGICGDQDELVDCGQMERLVNNSSSNLSAFEIVNGLTHFEACNYQNSMTNAANWLENSVFKD